MCPGTSWFMRMRLFEVMGAALQAFRTGPTVSCQFDGTYLNESLTGNRARSRTGMPRRCIQSSKSRQFALSISHTSLGACPRP